MHLKPKLGFRFQFLNTLFNFALHLILLLLTKGLFVLILNCLQVESGDFLCLFPWALAWPDARIVLRPLHVLSRAPIRGQVVLADFQHFAEELVVLVARKLLVEVESVHEVLVFCIEQRMTILCFACAEYTLS